MTDSAHSTNDEEVGHGCDGREGNVGRETSATNDSNDTSLINLNLVNYSGLIGFLLHFVNIILIVGYSEFPLYEDLSEKYTTIITPKSSAQIIFSVDFVLKIAFAVTQMLPRYRGKPIVQEGIGYLYFIVSVLQLGWTFAFFHEEIHLSVVLMFFILASSTIIVYAQHQIAKTESGRDHLVEFIVIRLPFQIYCGCALVFFALHISICAVKADEPASSLLTIGVITLTVLHAVSFHCVFGMTKPIYTIPFVLAWALIWIYEELKDPFVMIYWTFDPITVDGFRNSALTISLVCVVPAFAHMLVRLMIVEDISYLLLKWHAISE